MKLLSALAVLLAALMVPVQSPAQDALKPPALSVLYAFTGGADGQIPTVYEQLALDREGNLYGVATGGTPPNDACSYGCGLVFKIDRRGKESTLHAFTTAPPDGLVPFAGVTVDSWGNIYGTTAEGGTSQLGAGTIFKINREGEESIAHDFKGEPNGGNPSFAEGLTLGSNGDLYGTTQGGGTGTACPGGCGTVFKLDRNGKETVLYSFNDSVPGGPDPFGDLALDEEGNLYGTTSAGGAYGTESGPGWGTIFKVDPDGHKTVLYNFTGGVDGAFPRGVILGSKGTLYGVTQQGGNAPGFTGNGVVFKLDREGKYSVLYTFTGGADGGQPIGQLLLIGNDLYGTTFEGGDLLDTNCASYGGCGVVYKLVPNGKETVLYTFTGFADGDNPIGGLIRDAAGNLFGITEFGGDLASQNPLCGGFGCGVVYMLSPARSKDK